MSTENVIRMFKAASGNDELHAELNAAEEIVQIIEIGQRFGYKFDSDELDVVFGILPQDALDDADLEQVTGGARIPIRPRTILPFDAGFIGETLRNSNL